MATIRKKMPLAVATAFLFADPAHSAGIYTSGPLDGGSWAENRTQGTAVVFEGYLQGTMNGLALGSGTEFWNATGSMLKPEQVFLWMDKFCRENPLKDVINGAVTLMNEHTDGAYRWSQE